MALTRMPLPASPNGASVRVDSVDRALRGGIDQMMPGTGFVVHIVLKLLMLPPEPLESLGRLLRGEDRAEDVGVEPAMEILSVAA